MSVLGGPREAFWTGTGKLGIGVASVRAEGVGVRGWDGGTGGGEGWFGEED